MKYFFRFLMIMTRKGSLMPSVFLGSAGHVMYVVLTMVPTISSTSDWMSLSVMRLMWPLRTFLSQICSGFDPIEYRMERNPLWKVFLNILVAWLCFVFVGRFGDPTDYGFCEEKTFLNLFIRLLNLMAPHC